MKRIALFLPGGVGDEASGIHIPSLVRIICMLAERFSVTVYPIISPPSQLSGYQCGNALVRNLHLKQSEPSFTQLSTLAKAFLHDHRRTPYDLIHAFWALPTGCAGVVLAKMLHIPSVVSILGAETASLPQIEYGNMRRLHTRKLTLWTCRQADTLIAQTHFQAGELKAYGLVRRDIRIIPHTADIALFPMADKPFPHDPLRCLHVANLNSVKDQPMLLRAFSRIVQECDARLLIAGRDYLAGEIQAQAHRLGLTDKIEFLGFQTQAQLVAHFAWADLLLQSSLHEGGGVAVAEGAAMGVVACGTAVGLLADLGPERAVLVDAGDNMGLAREVLKLRSDPERYNRLRDGACQWIQSHDLAWTVEELSRAYDEVLRR